MEAVQPIVKDNYHKNKKKVKLEPNNLDELKYTQQRLFVYSKYQKRDKLRGGRVVEGARKESV